MRIAVGRVPETDEREQLVDALRDGGLPRPRSSSPNPMFRRDGHVRPQRVALEEHRCWPALDGHVAHVMAPDEDLAAVWLDEAADHAQQRRLAAA